MSTLYKNLTKLSIPLLNSEYQITDTPFGHNSLDIKHLSDEIISLFDEKGLNVSHVGTFRHTPNTITPIHTDNKTRGIMHDTIKLNWIVGGKDSVVNWYEPIDLKILTKEYLAPSKSTLPGGRDFEFYTEHDESNCKLIESKPLTGVVIMQPGTPHNISNPTEERFCFSVVLTKKSTKEYLTMQDGLDLFGSFL